MGVKAGGGPAPGGGGIPWPWLLPPALLGAFVRLFRLPSQLLLYDELHLPRALDALDLGQILTRYLPADNSIPLTALFEVLVDNGVALSELHLRAPSIVAGLAALVVVPAMLTPRLGRETAIAAAWLVAISPPLVAYSRIARPYMPVALLVFVAAMAFERWWRTGSRRAAAGYVAAGAAAAWLHLGAGPIVGAPLLWAAGAAALAWRRRRRDGGGGGRRPVEVVAVGLALAAAFAAFLLPAWPSFVALLADKSGSDRPGWGTLVHTLLLQAGAGHRWPAAALAAAVFLAAALGGLAVLLRRRPAFAGLTLTLVAANLAALLVTTPYGLVNPLVFSRYLLVGLPLVLAWAAAGLAWAWRAADARRPAAWRAARAAVAVAVLLLVVGGPLADRRLLYTSFLTDNDLVASAIPPPRPASPDLVPAFYRRLAAAPGDGAVVEVPGVPTWEHQTHLRIYQDVHRRRVLLAPHEETFFGPAFALANYVEPTPEALAAAPARWLVLHRGSAWELDRVAHGRRHQHVGLPTAPATSERSVRTMRHLRRDLRWRWGPPDHSERFVVVWDLDRVRRRLSQGR